MLKRFAQAVKRGRQKPQQEAVAATTNTAPVSPSAAPTPMEMSAFLAPRTASAAREQSPSSLRDSTPDREMEIVHSPTTTEAPASTTYEPSTPKLDKPKTPTIPSDENTDTDTDTDEEARVRVEAPATASEPSTPKLDKPKTSQPHSNALLDDAKIQLEGPQSERYMEQIISICNTLLKPETKAPVDMLDTYLQILEWSSENILTRFSTENRDKITALKKQLEVRCAVTFTDDDAMAALASAGLKDPDESNDPFDISAEDTPTITFQLSIPKLLKDASTSIEQGKINRATRQMKKIDSLIAEGNYSLAEISQWNITFREIKKKLKELSQPSDTSTTPTAINQAVEESLSAAKTLLEKEQKVLMGLEIEITLTQELITFFDQLKKDTIEKLSQETQDEIKKITHELRVNLNELKQLQQLDHDMSSPVKPKGLLPVKTQEEYLQWACQLPLPADEDEDEDEDEDYDTTSKQTITKPTLPVKTQEEYLRWACQLPLPADEEDDDDLLAPTKPAPTDESLTNPVSAAGSTPKTPVQVPAPGLTIGADAPVPASGSTKATPAPIPGPDSTAVPLPTLEDEIAALEALLRTEEYRNNAIVTKAAEKLIKDIKKEANHKPNDALTAIIINTRKLLNKELDESGIKAYHKTAIEWNKNKYSTLKKTIGTSMIVLALALVATAVVAVPFLSLAIAGAIALSTTLSTALAGSAISMAAMTNAVGGCLLFRKASVTREMDTLVKAVPAASPALSVVA